MGMRHQVYVVLPKDHPLAKRTPVIGIHHQWLYGHTAAHQLARFLTFVMKSGSSVSHPFLSGIDDPVKILSAIYSCDPENGYYSSVTPLVDEDAVVCKNPLLGDNNEGITVIDLRNFSIKDGKRTGKIAYAFVSFGHKDFVENTPMSAREYVHGYYPEVVPIVREKGKAVPSFDGNDTEAEDRVREVEVLKVAVMTQEALTEVFPTLKAPARPQSPAPRSRSGRGGVERRGAHDAGQDP